MRPERTYGHLPDLEDGKIHALLVGGPFHGQGRMLDTDKTVYVVDGIMKDGGDPAIGLYERDDTPAGVDVYWFKWQRGWVRAEDLHR